MSPAAQNGDTSNITTIVFWKHVVFAHCSASSQERGEGTKTNRLECDERFVSSQLGSESGFKTSRVRHSTTSTHSLCGRHVLPQLPRENLFTSQMDFTRSRSRVLLTQHRSRKKSIQDQNRSRARREYTGSKQKYKSVVHQLDLEYNHGRPVQRHHEHSQALAASRTDCSRS